MDTSMLGTLSQIAPDLMEEVELRALVLERVAALAPIGRRALAARLHLSEREVRSAAEALKEAGCLTQSASGMELTAHGESLVEAARVISRGRRSLSALELTLSRKLNVERVCVVQGDADREKYKDVYRWYLADFENRDMKLVDMLVHTRADGVVTDECALARRAYELGRAL